MLHFDRVLEALASHMLSCVEVRELQMAFQHMIKFSQVTTVALQREEITSLQVCKFFDLVLENFPKLKNYLAINVQIVHDKLFEFVVMNKIMKDEELNAEESNTNVAKFRKAYAAPATAMSDDYSEE